MRRWNGWGDENTHYHLPESAAQYLENQVGPGCTTPDATLEASLRNVPPSRLPPHPLVNCEPSERLGHACGQSLPDWVALRSGRIETFPDGVAYPADETHVRDLLNYARSAGARLIPYGGGTSVVGHINPLPGSTPVLTIDLSRLDRLVELDETSRLATFGAGVAGPSLEAQLKERGYTLGHYPQSFELSTLGGWIATRSSGQQSYYYGRIEDLFAGGHIETPLGPWELPPLPASAAGPDLRQVIAGSEGRIGLITQATMRVRRLPETEVFYGVFFRTWETGMEAVRQLAQERIPISMARLSNPIETDTTLRLAGIKETQGLSPLLLHGLDWLGYGQERCLLIFGLTGERRIVTQAHRMVREITSAHDGLFTGTLAGKAWCKSRFLTPYLRNTLWERGYAVDTLETALPWIKIPTASQVIPQTISAALQTSGERAHVFAHLSHIYRDGASLYTTYLFRRAPTPDETIQRWQAMKASASQAINALGGTISHQHGVGLDHVPYLEAEKGYLGMQLIRQAVQTLDPDGMMNPGKLV